MASAEQQAAFTSSWAPYANQVGAQTGVAPRLILAQWAAESGYGTQTSAGANNPGNLSTNGVEGNWQGFSSQQSFADAYSGLLQRNYPGALNTGDNASAFAAGLGTGNTGSYYGAQSPSSYASLLQGVEGNQYVSGAAGTTADATGNPGPGTAGVGTGLLTMDPMTGMPLDPFSMVPGTNTPTGQAAVSPDPALQQAGAATSQASGSVLASLGAFIQQWAVRILFVGLGIAVVIVGLVWLSKGAGATSGNGSKIVPIPV